MNDMNRKDFLLSLGALLAGGTAVLSGCGGGGEQAETTAKTATEAPKKVAAADPCTDVSGLTDAEKNMRTTLKYVAKSPEAEKNCVNCGLWVEPEAGAECGGCQVVKGPIHPEGYCTSWVAKPAERG